MSVSREARNGDSAEILRARPGTFTLEISRLTSLTRRVFSATSCIRRSRSLDACDRLSIRACTSGDGPCFSPPRRATREEPTRRGPGDGWCESFFSNLLDVTWITRSDAGVLHRKARYGSPRGRVPYHYRRTPSWGTTMDVTEPWATRPADPPAYLLSRWLFLRLLGAVYLVAFASLAVQVPGLLGEHGILPVGPFLERVHALYGGAAYRLFPTLCWIGAGDGMLRLLAWGGAGLALLLIAGVAPVPVLLLLWIDYLSLSVAGQTFLWFQWDALLLETGLLTVLYAPARLAPSLVGDQTPSTWMRWLLWWLLFRLM